jgi:citrate lyase subunit beta/citryl-CoA lyase
MLFVPGNNMKMLSKAATLEPDAIILDLEDSVPMDEKEKARNLVREGVKLFDDGNSVVFVRVNSLATGLTSQDLSVSACEGLHGIVLPKSESSKEIVEAQTLLDGIEKEKGLRNQSLAIVPLVETAKGVLNVGEISRTSRRVVAISFGAVDFARDLGVSLSQEGVELAYPRACIALAARAAGIRAVDTVFIDVKDSEGLVNDSKRAKQVGFQGKLLIHPDQIGPVNAVFSPTEHEVEYCKRVAQAFKEARSRGAGAISLDGKMIDHASYRQAEDTLTIWDEIVKKGKKVVASRTQP